MKGSKRWENPALVEYLAYYMICYDDNRELLEVHHLSSENIRKMRLRFRATVSGPDVTKYSNFLPLWATVERIKPITGWDFVTWATVSHGGHDFIAQFYGNNLNRKQFGTRKLLIILQAVRLCTLFSCFCSTWLLVRALTMCSGNLLKFLVA